MTTFNLQDMTIRSEKVSSKLRAYLYNISRYSNFNPDMMLRVFVASDGDFTAFEAKDYKLAFTSSDHKMMDTIKSKYAPMEVDYRTFARYVDSCY